MKIRPSIFAVVVIVAALISLILWLGKKQPVQAPPVAAVETNATPLTTIAPGTPIHSNAPPAAQAVSSAPVPLPSESKEHQMREELAELNGVDIAFYGRLEDQFGNAVGNAQIKFEIPFNNGHAVGVQRGTTEADENGFFTISGYKGKSLSVVPVQSGYVLASTNSGGIYSYLWPESERLRPDKNNPTVIKMWKLQRTEPLVDISKEYKLPFATTPINFDLVAGKVVSNGGDLEAVITRAAGSLSKKSPGDWSIELKPVNGGIIETDYQAAQFTFEAPADGYQEDYLMQMNHDNPAWHDGIDKEFFLKSRDGQVYGKFYFVFGINRDPNDLLYFQFKGVANANGSRNWEATTQR
jgi:hypothetical protein